MDKSTLLAGVDFARVRLLGSLEAIEKSGQDLAAVLAWRPGPGRAHIAWQAMHCAATHDRYINVLLRGGAEKDPALVAGFGGGSAPSDSNIPSLPAIRQALDLHLAAFKDYVAGLTPADLSRIVTMRGGQQRTVAESLLMMIWHESHHQGQIHLTWNLYRAAHGLGV